jgi:hypothetical protein
MSYAKSLYVLFSSHDLVHAISTSIIFPTTFE